MESTDKVSNTLEAMSCSVERKGNSRIIFTQNNTTKASNYSTAQSKINGIQKKNDRQNSEYSNLNFELSNQSAVQKNSKFNRSMGKGNRLLFNLDKVDPIPKIKNKNNQVSSPLKGSKQSKLEVIRKPSTPNCMQEINVLNEHEDNDENFTNKVTKLESLTQNKNHLNSISTACTKKIIEIQSSHDCSTNIFNGNNDESEHPADESPSKNNLIDLIKNGTLSLK